MVRHVAPIMKRQRYGKIVNISSAGSIKTVPHVSVYAATKGAINTVVSEARDTGHAALVLKSHAFATPALASAMEAAVPGVHVYAGICTDHMTGGLNVY